MPQRTPARSSPFHNQQQPQQQHAQQQHASSSVYHQEPQQFDLREEQQQYSGGGTASSSSNANSERSNRIASNHNQQQHRSSMLNLNNVNNNGGDMYLFQSNASVNNTCNSTGSSTTPPTSFQFHNMNNSQTFSSNKRRKQADSTNGGNTSSSASTNNTTTGIENSIFYHMETDFKRKHVDKKRLIWTNELHELFVNAVAQLGLNEARPKEILELMNLPDLTTTHIKSHLQKYRQQVKKGIVPLGISQSNNEMGTNSESETSDNEVLNEDVIVKQEAVSTTTSPFNNNQSSHQVYSFNSTTNPNQSSSSNIASSSQNFNSLINDTNSDQVNYIKNILLHFNQASANNSNNETGPSGSHNSFVPSSSSSSSASFQRPTQHVTFANSITNNNITTVNQPHFHLGDGSNILRNCHLLTSANSLSEFLVLLQEVCKAESDMAAIFNGLPVRSTHDLNLIVEGFRIGFICGMKYKP